MPKLIVSALASATCVLLGACGGGDSADDVLVFESRQAFQCGSRGLTTQQSAQKLVNGGIDVLASNCGVITGRVQATLCGLGTFEILIHQIRGSNLVDAEQHGFRSVTTLRDPANGIDYAKVDCDTGAILP